MNSAQLLPAIRELYSRHPEYFHHEPWELQHVLFSLGYVDRDRRGRRGGAPELAAMEGGLMEGRITARPQEYFALLVGASIMALFSALVATLCIKFEERGAAWFWAALFFGSALVGAYCLGKLV